MQIVRDRLANAWMASAGPPNPEGFNEALYCKSASLLNLTFHLDPKVLKVPDGKVAIAKLAALRFKRILWLRPRPVPSTDE